MQIVKRIRNHFKTSFSAALSISLLLLIVIIMSIFAVIKYFNNQLIAQRDAEKAVSVSIDVSTKAVEDYASALAKPLTSAAEDERIINWMIDGSGTQDMLAALSERNSTSNTNIWCIRGSDGVLLSVRTSEFLTLSSEIWYSYYSTGGKLASYVYCPHAPSSGKPAMVTIVPVIDNDNLIGFVGCETNSVELRKYFDRATFNSNCCMVLADKFGSVFYTPEKEDGFPNSVLIQQIVLGIYEKNDSQLGSNKYIISPVTGWEVIILYNSEKAYRENMELFRNELLLLLGLLVIMLIAVQSIVRFECREIPSISRSIAEISSGNYNFRINTDSRSEIGLIAQSVDELAEALQEKEAIIDDYSNLDMLTGIKNRAKMNEIMEDLIVCRTEDSGLPGFALLLIDIDNLRWINEVFGHKCGDQVLKVFAERLSKIFRRVYRFASDEFVALVELEDDPDLVDYEIKKFRRELESPIEVFAVDLYVKCSVGVAVFPDDGDSTDILMRNADVALSRAKERGKNRTRYYSSALMSNIMNKSAIAQGLTNALKNNEFFLNYQPIISTADGSIHGFEVLLRWESEELGNVPPSQFVKLAEETGAIVEIGTWIFETSCRFLRKLCDYNKDIIFSINVSPVQLEKKGFIDEIKRVLEITRVDPANIQVEITESFMLDFVHRQDKRVEEITELGINIALDDFGTGYSSLSYLKDLPVSCLKVDKSFVDEITNRRKDYTITNSTIDMVH